MATFYSDQITGLRASPQTKPDSGVSSGKERTQAFTWTGDAAQNDTVQLCRLPNGARVFSGRIDVTALGTSVTIALGDGTTAAKYLAANTVAAAGGQADFANTYALYGFGRERLSTATVLTATLAGANPDVGSIYGYVRYTVE